MDVSVVRECVVTSVSLVGAPLPDLVGPQVALLRELLDLVLIRVRLVVVALVPRFEDACHGRAERARRFLRCVEALGAPRLRRVGLEWFGLSASGSARARAASS